MSDEKANKSEEVAEKASVDNNDLLGDAFKDQMALPLQH